MPQITAGTSVSSSAQIVDGIVTGADIAATTITDANIAANAAIAMSKLSLAIVDAQISAHTTSKITVPVSLLSNVGGATGDLIVGSSTSLVRMAMGSALQVLRVNAGATALEFATAGGDWVQLGETILSGAATSIAVSSFAARKDLMIVFALGGPSGACSDFIKANSLGGAVYGWTTFEALVPSTTNATAQWVMTPTDNANDRYWVLYIKNISAQKKLVYGFGQIANATGATAPTRNEMDGVLNKTDQQITTISVQTSDGSSTYPTGSRITVYGSKD